MDMSEYTTTDGVVNKLARHCEAIRKNKDILADVFLHLACDPPNASAARESFGELSQNDQTAIWSVSTSAGGIWERWERDAIKYGDIDTTNAYDVWKRRY